MKKFYFVLSVLLLFATQTFTQVEIPILKGNWWLACENEPDISPYTYTGEYGSPACDFTMYKDDYGKWHCISCIRGTTYPGSTRLFYEWTADSITQTDWVGQGIFWTSGTIGTPDALGYEMGVNTPYTVEGRMQAPHAFKYNNHHYMFYNNAGAFCYDGTDGDTWDYMQDYNNNYKFFDMGRDVMIFNNLDQTGLWYAYYTGNADMIARTATTLEGPWSDEIPLGTTGNPESPFVLRRGTNDYYLWEQMNVFHSNDPTKFDGYMITKMTPHFFAGKYAPEIMQDNGKWYIAGYSSGLWISEFEWVSPDLQSVNAYLSSMTIDEGTTNQAFDSITTHYTMTVPNSVTNLTINTVTSNPGSTVELRSNTGLIEGTTLVEIIVSTPGDVATRIYDIKVTRLAPGQETYTLTVNGGSGSGEYIENASVDVIAAAPVYGKEFSVWTGDISYLANVNSASTILNMPAQAVNITATYVDLPLQTLIVNRGTGGGDYLPNDEITITADAAHVDSVFYAWEGDVENIDNIYTSPATLTMPFADINITAVYRDLTATLYTLNVTDGTGSGDYMEGSEIPIVANPPPALQNFDIWTGDVSYIDNVNSDTTFVIMPAATVNISVQYYNAPPAPPQNITAITGEDVVNLDWSNNSEGDFNHYKVYRSETSATGYVLIDGNVTQSEFSDNTVVTSTTYYYVITAVDDNYGESPYSLEFSVTPVAGAVSYISSDLTTNDAWRSTNVTKADDVDNDDVYGTDGYYLFAFAGGSEMKSLPGYISNVSFGSNASTVPFGVGAPVDDPTLIPGSDLADVNPLKLDLDIADATEGEFLTINVSNSCSFRLGVYSGHSNSEVAASIRVEMDGSTTSQIALSSSQQWTLIDIVANAGDNIVIYGTTQAVTQSRNCISGIFFDSNFDAPLLRLPMYR